MPLISVIVPVYKVEPYLHRCVDSILAQTFTDFELILVDDGSPDNCGAICDEYAAKDERIHVIHQANGGLSAARNAGLEWAFANSESQWLSFVDSDDWVHPCFLEYLYRAVEENQVSVSVCGFKRVEEYEDSFPTIDYAAETVTWDVFYLRDPVAGVVVWNKLYRKDVFKDLRYPVGKIHEDEFITYRILFECRSLAFVNFPLYAYFYNENGISKAKWSPKRLDALDAFSEKIRFFKKKNWSSMTQNSFFEFIHAGKRNIATIREERELSTFKKRVFISKVRAKALRVYICNFNEAKWTIYEDTDYANAFFPFFMKVYRLIKRQ